MLLREVSSSCQPAAACASDTSKQRPREAELPHALMLASLHRYGWLAADWSPMKS